MEKNKTNQKKKTNTILIISICVASVVILAAVVTVVVLMTADKYDRIVYDKTTGDYISENTGIVYHAFGANFEPVSHGKEVAAILDTAGYEEELYRITGMDEDNWYTTDNGDIYSTIKEIPKDITGIEASRVDICRDNVNISSLAQIYVKNEIKELTDALTSSEKLTYPAVEPAVSYVLRFTLGGSYTGLYYKVLYTEYSEDITADEDEENSLGKCFLYDRWTGKCVPAGDVVSRYIAKQ